MRRTALVQLASADACVLAHVYSLERLPPRLSALLEDPAVLKVGTGVISDLDKLAADFGVRPMHDPIVPPLRVSRRVRRRCNPRPLWTWRSLRGYSSTSGSA